jgi:alpha-beta hydrolase superfamily lysophospholipase
MTAINDGGLANDYWHKYYTPAEVQEIIAGAGHTMIISGNFPIFVRIYQQPQPAPTIVMAHGMLVYGLILARLQLPFYRAGYNVVQFDIPGLGLSGGPRGGCTTRDIFRVWSDAITFAYQRFGAPLFAMGVAEDGVTCYYAAANHPSIRALSVHTLFEYGDPRGVHWIGGELRVKLQASGLAVASAARPTITVKGTKGIPWEDVFGGPDDEEFIKILEDDPLALQRVELRFARSLIKSQPAPVPFEACRTPVQIIASDENKIWPYEMVEENYARLGGPKELVRLHGKPQWESNRPFHEAYCDHVDSWFREHGAAEALRRAESGAWAPRG